MGEAKRKKEVLKKIILHEMDNWTMPTSDWEIQVIAELDQLPRVNARLAPPEQVAWMRMKHRECHNNCYWYEKNDATKQWKQVLGWTVLKDAYAKHSVVYDGEEYVCISPQPIAAQMGVEYLAFVPDPKLTWETSTGKVFREGIPINGVGVRRDVDVVRARIAQEREILLKGNFSEMIKLLS